MHRHDYDDDDDDDHHHHHYGCHPGRDNVLVRAAAWVAHMAYRHGYKGAAPDHTTVSSNPRFLDTIININQAAQTPDVRTPSLAPTKQLSPHIFRHHQRCIKLLYTISSRIIIISSNNRYLRVVRYLFLRDRGQGGRCQKGGAQQVLSIIAYKVLPQAIAPHRDNAY
eukprot:71249-Pelagomonas_calceolata.AAC.1